MYKLSAVCLLKNKWYKCLWFGLVLTRDHFECICRQITILSFIYSSMANVRNKSTLSTEQSRPQPRVFSSDSTFTCPLCPSILSSRTHLLRHVSSKHDESLFAVCKTCMQCFAPKDIDGHMNACKGPYVCPYCHHTFALLAYLNRHIRRKHSTDDENKAPSSNTGGGSGPRYTCKFCSNAFSSNNALNLHIQRHLNFACSSCGSKINRESKELITCGSCGNRLSFDGKFYPLTPVHILFVLSIYSRFLKFAAYPIRMIYISDATF